MIPVGILTAVAVKVLERGLVRCSVDKRKYFTTFCLPTHSGRSELTLSESCLLAFTPPYTVAHAHFIHIQQ